MKPWLAGIFAGTLFLVGIRWLTTVLPGLYFPFAVESDQTDCLRWIATYSSHFIANIFFAVCYGLCSYFYFCTMLFEPGYVPKLGGLTEQKAVIDELLSLWKFDDQNFCVTCMVRMPLRSKHCKRCNRCVAKHDQ